MHTRVQQEPIRQAQGEPLQAYGGALKRALPILLLASFGAALVAYVITSGIKPTRVVHFSYVVSLQEREQAADYRYDGYYAIQSTDLFAATLAQWIQTPEVVVAAHKRAGVSLPELSPRELADVVHAQKTAPQLVEVTVQDESGEKARAIARGLREVMSEQVSTYQKDGIPELRYRVVSTDEWVGVTKLSVPVVTIATFIFVLLIGVNVVLLGTSVTRFRID